MYDFYFQGMAAIAYCIALKWAVIANWRIWWKFADALRAERVA